jgi:hypothetical protein
MKKFRELKKEAMKLNACDRGLAEWSELRSDLDLVKKYVKEIEFCAKHDFPSVEYIKRNFSKDVLHRGGVWVDENVPELPTRNSVLNGHCVGAIEFSGIMGKVIHIRHTSEIELIASGASRLFVHLYDDAKLKAKTTMMGRIYVYQHGGEVVEMSGDVLLRNSRKGEVE